MRDYSSAKIELMALKWSVCNKFKDYLLGSKFTIFTDNNPLCYIRSSKLGAAQLCWFIELSLYDFDIVYPTGKSNLVTDTLSCRPEVKEAPSEGDNDEWITVSYQVEEQDGRISSAEFNQAISKLVGGGLKLTKSSHTRYGHRKRKIERKNHRSGNWNGQSVRQYKAQGNGQVPTSGPSNCTHNKIR